MSCAFYSALRPWLNAGPLLTVETFLETLKGIYFPRSGPASSSCVVAWRPGLSFWAFRAGRCEQKNAKEELELQKFEHLPRGAQPHGVRHPAAGG